VEQIKGVTYKIQTFLGEPTWRTSDSEKPETKYNSTLVHDMTKLSRDENDNQVAKDKSMSEVLWGGMDVVSYLFRASQEQVCAAEDWQEYRAQLLTRPDHELYQAVVYLAPGDYHRFHSPVHWQINFRRHFQGELLSVNPRVAGWVPELFSLNERVVYAGTWQHGFFSMTAVGATNVGSISVYCDKGLHTNTRKWRDGTRHRDRFMDATWTKGEEVGEFRMGSTIVLIFEAPKDYEFNFGCNQVVKVGQSLCCSQDFSKKT